MTYTLNNNFKIFLKSKPGVELKTWLEKHKNDLSNHRIFYILRANLDKGDVFKIGISERGDTSAYGRLNDYYNHMGKSNSDNKCLGVKLHLVVGNLFNPSVQTSDSKVRQMETKLIQSLGKPERGRERFKISIDKLFKKIEDLGLLKGDESAAATKRSPRVLEHNQASKDTVKAILGHKTLGGVLKFEVEFHDYIKYDKNQNAKLTKQAKQYLTYDSLVQLREGKRIVDLYIKKNNLK